VATHDVKLLVRPRVGHGLLHTSPPSRAALTAADPAAQAAMTVADGSSRGPQQCRQRKSSSSCSMPSAALRHAGMHKRRTGAGGPVSEQQQQQLPQPLCPTIHNINAVPALTAVDSCCAYQHTVPGCCDHHAAHITGNSTPVSLHPSSPSLPQLLQPQPPGRAGEGFAPAHVVAEVSLLPQKVSIGLERRPVRARGEGEGQQRGSCICCPVQSRLLVCRRRACQVPRASCQVAVAASVCTPYSQHSPPCPRLLLSPGHGSRSAHVPQLLAVHPSAAMPVRCPGPCQ
jgi:hypothetical protein